jgi:uncharacterized membrane protein (DUF485 family)
MALPMGLPTESYGRHRVLHGQDEMLFESTRWAPPAPTRPAQHEPDYARIRGDADFVQLRRRLRRFIFPMSALFMGWYMTFVLLAAYAHAFMAKKVLGLINMGIVLGLAQFLSTLLIMWLYCRYAARTLDPAVADIRAQSGVRS